MSDTPEFDMSALLQQAQQLQQQLVDAQQDAAAQVVEGNAGGGVVRIQATGGLEFRDVTIDRAVVDPSDVEMLQDLVLAALRDVVAKASELNQRAMGPMGAMLSGLGGGLPGLGGGLGGALGGSSGRSGGAGGGGPDPGDDPVPGGPSGG